MSPGLVTGIDSDNGDLPGRRGQQQRAQVLLENSDGFDFGTLSKRRANFALYRGKEKPLVGIANGSLQQWGKLRLRVADHSLEQAGHELFGVDFDGVTQYIFTSAAPNSQDSMRRYLRHRFLEVVVHL